jgi:hypothetical protein
MFVIVAATILAIVLIGFAPTLYLRTRVGGIDQALGNNSLPVHLVVHGVVLTAWFSLLLIQPSLVATGNRRMHMRLGLLGIAVAVGVVATGVYTLMQYVVRMKAVGQVLKATPDQVEAAMKQFAVPVIVGDSLALLVFVILFSAAIYWRAKPVAHKRLMLLSSLFILGPAFSSVRPVGETLDPLLGHEAPWLFSPGYVSPRSCGSTTRPRDDFSALLCGEPVFSPLLLDWRAP